MTGRRRKQAPVPETTHRTLEIPDSRDWEPVVYRADTNPTIDALVRRKVMQDVWVKLSRLFPLVKANELAIWAARRDGSVEALVLGNEAYRTLRQPLGPQHREEWELLGQAAIAATFKQAVSVEELALPTNLGPYQPFKQKTTPIPTDGTSQNQSQI